MARLKTAFFCTDCGNEAARWQGQCPACGSWNTLVEEPSRPARNARSVAAAPVADPVRLSEVEGADAARWATGARELDFVLGGGIVPGSIVLVGGEPGIGKSTLLLQAAARLQASGRTTLYVSGEESAAQVRMRADRLQEPAGDVVFLGETRLEAILDVVSRDRPDALFIDSIQTVYSGDYDGAAGSVTQVRECAARLQRLAKETGSAVFLIGHVTKGGTVAGPKTLEHIVDTVLYFEETGTLDHRVLRSTKNRFGAADELGVFRMTAAGLEPVANPSELFIRDRADGVSGTAVAAVIEGTRPLLVEVQALCTRASYGAPQRVATGFDRQRLALLLAVMEKRAGIDFSALDVFINVVGGIRIAETASDAALLAALASSVYDLPTDPSAVFLGEVGLGGELRPIGQLERRLAEAARMGFRTAYFPGRAGGRAPSGSDMVLVPAATAGELVQRLFGRAASAGAPQ
ncbi:MAG TPA: DNA repair protein RadA [Longimicrobiales bacterium]|nr:DNA repair protein RadA [Longimicrobiales bacterium]